MDNPTDSSHLIQQVQRSSHTKEEMVVMGMVKILEGMMMLMKEVGDQTEGWWVGVLDGNDVMAEG